MMLTDNKRHSKSRERGIAMLEMAVFLPLLLILALPVIDYGRNLLDQLAMTGLAREVGNLVSRYQANQPMQTLLQDLANSAPSLDMAHAGRIVVTQLKGDHCALGAQQCQALVVGQYQWNGGGYHGGQAIWQCASSYDRDGFCQPVGGSAVVTSLELNGKLYQGQDAFVVEVFYQFEPLFPRGILGVGAPPSEVSARTVF